LKIRFGFILCALLLISPLAMAQSFRGPIASGMGGAGRAAFDPAESAYLNPASLAALRTYFGSAYYSTASHPLYGNDAKYGALLSDGNAEGLFAGALGYTHGTISAPTGHDSSEDFFAAAAGYIIPNLSVAVSGHYVMDTFAVGQRQNQINGSLGLMYSVSESLAFGLIGRDLGGTKKGVPDRDQLVPAYGGGMTYYWAKTLQYRLDVEYPDQLNPRHRPDVMTGVESYVAKALALRGGFRWQESEAKEGHYLTMGFGLHGPKIALDYSFEKDLLVAGGTRHTVDLWMPF
jgi:hypothetical protein